MNNQLAAGRDADRRERNTTTTTGSVIAAIVAYVDRATSHTLTDHIRAGYPTYAQARIDTAATTLPCLPGLVAVTLLWSRSK